MSDKPEIKVTRSDALVKACNHLLSIENVSLPADVVKAHAAISLAWATIAQVLGPEEFVRFDAATFRKVTWP